MARKYEKDRFDVVPDDLQRVGAHRVPRRRGAGWIAFGWAALATVVLVGLGALWILSIDNKLNLGFDSGNDKTTPSASASAPTASATPSIAPTLDPDATVLVLNGTDTAGLAGDATDLLAAKGWQTQTPSNTDESGVATSTVYYSDAGLEGAAKGVAKALGGLPITLSESKPGGDADIAVVLGADYEPPTG